MSPKKISFKIPPKKTTSRERHPQKIANKIDQWVVGNEKKTDGVKKKRLSVDIEESLFRQFKKLCIEQNTTLSKKIQSFVKKCVE